MRLEGEREQGQALPITMTRSTRDGQRSSARGERQWTAITIIITIIIIMIIMVAIIVIHTNAGAKTRAHACYTQHLHVLYDE